MRLDTRRFTAHSTILGALALASAGAVPAGAQTPTAALSLSPAVTAAASGQTITFTVLLNGGNNTGGYDFNVLLGSPTLSYTAAGFTFNQANGFSGPQSSTVNGNSLDATANIPLAATTGLGPQTATALGTFSVVSSSVSTPTVVTVQFDTTNGNSEVFDFNGNTETTTVTNAAVTVTPAPEPSALLSAALGLGGIGLLAWRKRRTA